MLCVREAFMAYFELIYHPFYLGGYWRNFGYCNIEEKWWRERNISKIYSLKWRVLHNKRNEF
jgi:hypothetical protein